MNVFELAIVVSAVDRASAAIRRVQGATDQLRTSAERVAEAGRALQSWSTQATIAGGIMKGAGDQIVGSLASVTRSSLAVDEAMTKVATLAKGSFKGDVTQGLRDIRNAGLEWASQHKESASQFIDTTYAMLSAGLNERQAVEATRTAMAVAAATMGEGKDAADLLATVYNNMGDKSADAGKELARLGDIVTQTQAQFQFADFNQLGEGLKYGIPIALQTGVRFEELSTILGQFNNAGIQGSMAGTAFGSMMSNLQKGSTKLSFALAKNVDGSLDFVSTLRNIEAKYGDLRKMSPETLAQFREVFGDEGFRGLSLLIGRSGELATNLQKVANSTGATAEATKIIDSSAGAGWQILANNVENAKVAIGDQLGPALADLVPKATEAVKSFTEFAKEHPTLTQTAAVIAGVVGSLLAIGGTALVAVGGIGMFAGQALTAWPSIVALAVAMKGVALSVWGVTSALLANPITWIVLGIAAAAYLIYKNWEPISAFFQRMWGAVSAAFASVHPVEWISGAFDGLMAWLSSFSLATAGSKILGTLTSGILAAASAPVDAVLGVVGKIRNLLPFSPAKDGPLRDLHRVRLIETVAEAVRPAPLVTAMRGAASAAMLAMPLVAATVPPLAPALAPMGRMAPDGGSAAQGGMVVHINIQGGADASVVEQLERWVRGNGRAIRAAVERDRARDGRTELG